MEEYVDHFFNVHEFSSTQADNYCSGEHEETWSLRIVHGKAVWKLHLENHTSSSFSRSPLQSSKDDMRCGKSSL